MSQPRQAHWKRNIAAHYFVSSQKTRKKVISNSCGLICAYASKLGLWALSDKKGNATTDE